MTLLFVLFSPLWWLLIVGSFAAVIYALEQEKHAGKWAASVVLVTLGLLIFSSDTPVLVWLTANWWWAAPAYIVIGVIWCLFRWDRYGSRKGSEYVDAKRQWLRDHGVNEGKEIPDDLKAEFNQFLLDDDRWSYTIIKKELDEEITKHYSGRKQYREKRERVICVRPLAWQHKAKISNWMTYWPWSFTWWVADDFIRGIFRYCQEQIADVLEWISIRRFKGVESDYTVKAVEPVVEETK